MTNEKKADEAVEANLKLNEKLAGGNDTTGQYSGNRQLSATEAANEEIQAEFYGEGKQRMPLNIYQQPKD